MHKVASQKFFLLPVLLLAAWISRLQAAPASVPVPEYKVGETATVDVVTPVHLIVIDHERTEQLRQQEAQRIPAIFRSYPGAVEEAEAGLQQAITSARDKFLDALELSYGKRSLNEVQVNYPRFQRLVGTFQRPPAAFPVSTNLAEVWAMGGSDETFRTNLLAKLRDIMTHPIRVDLMPAQGRIGPRQVKMIAVRPKDAELNLATVEKQATNYFRTNIYTLSRARKELQNAFPAEERGIGRFVVGFVKVNCEFDSELTDQGRKKKTAAIWSADEYDPGQLVVKRGDVIDSRLKAVLDQLRERATGVQAKRDLAQGHAETQAAVAQLHEEAVRAQSAAAIAAERVRWLVGGIAGASLAFLFVLWRLARWKRSNSLLPARIRNDEIAGTVIACPSCAGTIVLPLELSGSAQSVALPPQKAVEPPAVTVPETVSGDYWKERALAAERRAAETGQVLRKALIPHMARWLMSKLVRGLAMQRKQLLETQKKAEQELAELEQRLSAVQAPLEDRLKAYEQRIAELEKGLNAKGEENRELIKATIAMAKKKLQQERSKDRLAWN